MTFFHMHYFHREILYEANIQKIIAKIPCYFHYSVKMTNGGETETRNFFLGILSSTYLRDRSFEQLSKIIPSASAARPMPLLERLMERE